MTEITLPAFPLITNSVTGSTTISIEANICTDCTASDNLFAYVFDRTPSAVTFRLEFEATTFSVTCIPGA
jgi:hypothetical protein